MTETIEFIVRACDNCGERAVPLGGRGEKCAADCSGRYEKRVGTTVREIPDGEAETVREAYPEALA